MAPPAPVAAPDYKNIPHSHRLPVAHREVKRALGKLSRPSLISLAQQWLSKKNRDFCRPYLLGDDPPDDDDEDAQDRGEYDPAQSYEELQEIYKELAARKGAKSEVLDRILAGDWRTGISMYQLATAEIQHLLDHPTALRWTAHRLAKIPNSRSAVQDMEVTNDSEHLPRFQAQTFMMNLAKELTPLLKAHYLITRIKTIPITILRVYIHNSPYSTEASLAADTSSADGAKAVFFIWPNGSPFVYSSLATHLGQVVGDDGRHLRNLVQQAIPKAFSRPSARYQLTGTNFTARSLSALLAYRGPGKSNAATGGWSIFADHSFSQNALDFITTQRSGATDRSVNDKESAPTTTKAGPGRPKRLLEDTETPEGKRRKELAEGRFGSTAKPNDGQGIDRFEVRIEDPFPALPSRNTQEDDWVPEVRLTFQGSHVFAGIRELVEQGVVDGEKMPGWMTGEGGVTNAVIKQGRIRTRQGKIPGL